MSDKEKSAEFWKKEALALVVLLRAKCSEEEWASMESRFAAECTAPAPQPAELREALRKALDLIWEHHEIGFIHRAYEAGVGSCELCKDSRLLAIGKVLEAADAAATPQVMAPAPQPAEAIETARDISLHDECECDGCDGNHCD